MDVKTAAIQVLLQVGAALHAKNIAEMYWKLWTRPRLIVSKISGIIIPYIIEAYSAINQVWVVLMLEIFSDTNWRFSV